MVLGGYRRGCHVVERASLYAGIHVLSVHAVASNTRAMIIRCPRGVTVLGIDTTVSVFRRTSEEV